MTDDASADFETRRVMVWSVSAFFRTATPCSHSVVVSHVRASGAASRSAFLTAPQVAYSRTARLSRPRRSWLH